MEKELRDELLPRAKELAKERIVTNDLQEKSRKGVEMFVREFLLTKIIDGPAKDVRVRLGE